MPATLKIGALEVWRLEVGGWRVGGGIYLGRDFRDGDGPLVWGLGFGFMVWG